LADANLTLYPSPARYLGGIVEILTAGESFEERGRSPLSNSLPLLNRINPRNENEPVREGEQGGE
jgi:hypothetical protein